jgi:uncharacterized oxidoreductase
MRLTGKTVLVTGAGTGMGLEAARQLTALGNQLIMVARNKARLETEAARLPDASPFACDISDETQVAGLVDYVQRQHPELDILFLNAGVTHTYGLFGGQDAYRHAAEEMATNYLSAVRLTHAFEPLLRGRTEPAFVITTSGAALVPDISNPTYSATKAALHSYVQSMRLTLARRQSPIMVFEILAPLVDSPFAAAVHAPGKLPPAQVIAEVIEALGHDVLEIRPGPAEQLYQLFLQSPEQALEAINAMTNADGNVRTDS